MMFPLTTAVSHTEVLQVYDRVCGNVSAMDHMQTKVRYRELAVVDWLLGVDYCGLVAVVKSVMALMTDRIASIRFPESASSHSAGSSGGPMWCEAL